MRRELTDEEIVEIKENEWVVLSTARDNKPRAIVVMPSIVEKNRIIISNIQMENTIQNLEMNNNCFIDIYLKDKEDKQIKINGISKIDNQSSLFKEVKEYEEKNNLPEELKVKSIIIVEFIDIEVSEG